MHIKTFSSNYIPYNISNQEISLFKASGHPQIILDGNEEDILTNVQKYLEKIFEKDIFDQNGGEFLKFDRNFNKINCTYVLFDIDWNDGNGENNIFINIKGFFVNNSNILFVEEISFD